MAYDIEGKLLEVCTCNVLCPCWVGEVTGWGLSAGAPAMEGTVAVDWAIDASRATFPPSNFGG